MLVGIGTAGLFLLAAACWAMQARTLPPWAVAALAAGLGAWIAVAALSAGEGEALGPLDAASVGHVRLAIGLPVAVALAALAWRETAAAAFTLRATASWLGAVAAWVIAWWPAGGRRRAEASLAPASRRVGIGAALLLIMAIGAFFRFHRIAEIPPQPGSDHAEDLLNLVELDSRQRPTFFPRNTGQAPLPFYFEWVLHRALRLPLNHRTLKVSTAVVGMAAIPAMYALGAELGGAPLGLIAAALCAWSKWPTLGARRGLTFAWAVFPAALALAVLMRYMRRGDRGSALWTGLWLGIGQFGYNAFKIVPLMVPVAFAAALFDSRWKGRRGRLVADGLLITATALLVFLPLLHYMVQRPQEFWYRAMTRAGGLERPLPGPAPLVFGSNLENMLLAFHWKGDHAWINTVTEEPFLDPVTGGLLLAGVVVAGARAVRGSRRWAVILASIVVLTLASTLSLAFPIENPGINRAAVAIPSVLVLAALPAAWLIRATGGRRAARILVGIALAALAALSIHQNYQSYFVRFEREQTMILEPVLDVVRIMREHHARGIPYDNMYLLNTSNWIDGRCIGFEIGDLMWQGAHDVPPHARIPAILDRPLVFFVHPSDEEHRQEIKERFPQAEERLVPQFFRDRNYYVYFVPR